MLKAPGKYRKDEILAAAEVLELMFYSDENVVTTLMAADMGSYILPMLECKEVKVQTCALACLESILMTPDVTDFVVEYGYVPVLLGMYKMYLGEPDISCPAFECGIIKCMECLGEHSGLPDAKINWELFITNCLSRLDN